MNSILRDLIADYNKENVELKNLLERDKISYTPVKLEEIENQKKKEIKEKFLPQIESLITDLETAKDTTSKDLIKKRYPKSFTDKMIGELEISHAQRVVDTGEQDKVLNNLKLAFTIERYDFISYTLDSLLPSNTDTTFGIKLRDVEQELNVTLKLDDIKKEIASKEREGFIAETFLKDATAGTEAIFPFSLEEIKGMSRETIQPMLNLVNRSMRINGEAEKRSLRMEMK